MGAVASSASGELYDRLSPKCLADIEGPDGLLHAVGGQVRAAFRGERKAQPNRKFAKVMLGPIDPKYGI